MLALLKELMSAREFSCTGFHTRACEQRELERERERGGGGRIRRERMNERDRQ